MNDNHQIKTVNTGKAQPAGLCLFFRGIPEKTGMSLLSHNGGVSRDRSGRCLSSIYHLFIMGASRLMEINLIFLLLIWLNTVC